MSAATDARPGNALLTDLLRAAVVFTHACLEDFLRSISAAFLPWADEVALNAVPLVGSLGRAEKFFLGRLVHHRNKQVQEVLQESVNAYLEESNYNDTTEIARVLASIDMRNPAVEALFADLSAMIERRHQIVHRADRIETPGKARQRSKSLSAKTVSAWIEATARFIAILLAHVSTKPTKYKRIKAT